MHRSRRTQTNRPESEKHCGAARIETKAATAHKHQDDTAEAESRISAAMIDTTTIASKRLFKLNCQGRFMPPPE